MKGTNPKPILGLILLVTLLSAWYFQDRLKMERHASSYSELLARIHNLDTAMDRDMERISAFHMANYDSLVGFGKELLKMEKELEELTGRLSGWGDPGLMEGLQNYLDKIRQKLGLLDDLKSKAAVIRNSLIYLPELVDTVAQQDPHLELPLQRLLSRILGMQLFPSVVQLETVVSELDALDLEEKRMAPILGHLHVSLREGEALRDLAGRFQAVESGALFKGLQEKFMRYRAAQGRTPVLVGLLLILLVMLLMSWLWRTLKHLEWLRSQAESSRHRLEDAVESLGDGFALFDAGGRLLLFNRTFGEYYPWLKEDLEAGGTATGLERLIESRVKRQPIPGEAANSAGDSSGEKSWLEVVDDVRWYLARNSATSEGGSVWVRTDITSTREAEAELRKLGRAMEQSPVSVVITDSSGFIEYVNPKFEQVSGYSEEELIGQRPSVLKSGDMTENDYAEMWQTILSGREWKGIFHNRRKDGSLYWESARISPIRDEAGEITHFIGIKEDITRLREYQESLRLSATVFDSTTEGIVLTDAQGRIRTVNPAFTRITGYQPEEVLGKLASIFDSEDGDQVKRIREELVEHQRWPGELTDFRKDGSWYHQWLSITTLHDDKGLPSGYVIIFSDITQHKADQAKILHQANHDLLTDLPNRTLLMDRLNQAVLVARRQHEHLAVVFIDLDRFKTVNDLYGHVTGDELLQQVAERLRSAVREVDTVARFGGDEFVVLLQNLGSGEEAALVAGKIIELLSRPFDLERRQVTIGASLGITLYPNDVPMSASVEEACNLLLSNADMAMYQAKARGRNHFQFFEQRMQEEIKVSLVLEQDLRHAMLNNELEVYYQPIHAMPGGEIVAVEALLRWHHPLRGMISPASFIPLAEETGMIYEIGGWMFREACRRVQSWHAEGQLSIGVSLNLSARQRDRGFGPEELRGLLQETGIDPALVTLEITENLFLEESEIVLEWLHGLKETGVSLSVDDFGTGYSSLSYLKLFPVDTLKIDQSFVRGLPEDQDDVSLVRAIISMAESLDIGVVAEGVETEAQRQFLLDLGCRFMQGFRFDPPMPAAEILRKFGTAGD